MTTSITQEIQDYRDGDLEWPELLESLANRDYPTPARMKGTPQQAIDDYGTGDERGPWSEDGTWDEVKRAHNVGLLSDGEYGEILAAALEAHSP